MNRTNAALLGVFLVAVIAIVAGIRLATPAESAAGDARPVDSPETRPSPVAESVEVIVRSRMAPETPQQPVTSVQAATRQDYNSSDTSKDWSVVAATLSSVEQADKRARSLKDTWSDCACTVFPRGESERFFVVVGTGLDRNAADRLRDRATAAGLPGDTYVTKLIRRPGDSQP